MTDLKQIRVDGLPSLPNDGLYWELRADVQTDVLATPNYRGHSAQYVEQIPTGFYTLYLVDINQNKEYDRTVGDKLTDELIVRAADSIIDEYTSYNRAKALEEGPLRVVPAKTNIVYVLDC